MKQVSETEAGRLLVNILVLVIICEISNIIFPHLINLFQTYTDAVQVINIFVKITQIYNSYIGPALIILAVYLHLSFERKSFKFIKSLKTERE